MQWPQMGRHQPLIPNRKNATQPFPHGPCIAPGPARWPRLTCNRAPAKSAPNKIPPQHEKAARPANRMTAAASSAGSNSSSRPGSRMQAGLSSGSCSACFMFTRQQQKQCHKPGLASSVCGVGTYMLFSVACTCMLHGYILSSAMQQWCRSTGHVGNSFEHPLNENDECDFKTPRYLRCDLDARAYQSAAN
jgi:hypothetical protein